MSKSSLPKQPAVIDTKVRDTSANQIFRFCMVTLNLVVIVGLSAGFLPVGIAYALLTGWIWGKITERRKRRYSNNARTLAEMNYGRSI